MARRIEMVVGLILKFVVGFVFADKVWREIFVCYCVTELGRHTKEVPNLVRHCTMYFSEQLQLLQIL
jgi:hypothetical protein